MDETVEDESGKEASASDHHEAPAETKRGDSFENELKLQTDNSIDLLTASFESADEKPEPHVLVAEKIRRLLPMPVPAEIVFGDASMAAIRAFADEPERKTLFVGLADDRLIATFTNRDLPEETSNVSFLVKQRAESLRPEDFISRVMHFSVPMDARSASLHLMQSTFARNFIFDEHSWPETTKSKLTAELHQCFMTVNEEKHAKLNQTYLYVPLENLNGDTSAVIGQMEDAVARWYKQVKEAVGAEDMDAKLPKLIDMIQFWENKYKNITFLEEQLSSKPIQKVLSVLTQEKSFGAEKLKEIIANTACAKLEAKCCMDQINKMRHLGAKLEACATYTEADPLISETLIQIKDLYKGSSYFSNRLAKILICLGNQIIEICSKSIQLRSLLKGKPVLGTSKANEAAQNCRLFFDKFHQHFADPDSMNLGDPKELFCSILAFVNRCKDLCEVFEAMRIFARIDEANQVPSPIFGGANGSDFEDACEVIRKETIEAIREIALQQNSALDVACTKWQQHMEKFKLKIERVEQKVEVLVHTAMDDASNIYEGLNTLQQLLHFLQKPSLAKYLKEKSEKLYMMLLKDVQKSTRSLLGGKLIGYSGFPPFSGVALMAHNSRSYLVGQMLLLEQSTFLAECDSQQAATRELAFYVSIVDETIQEVYDRWVIDLPIDWEPKLRRSLISYHPAYDNLIEPTLGSDIFETIEEIRVWKSLGFEAPEKMLELFALEDPLGRLRDDVQIICHQFNEAIKDIQPEDFGLFEGYLALVKQDLKPAMYSYTWMSKGADEYLDRRIQSTLNFKKLTRELNTRKEAIKHLCYALALSKIVEINCTDLFSFSQVQSNFETAVKATYSEIIKCLEKLEESFGETLTETEVQVHCKNFYMKINTIIEESVLEIVRRSCKSILDLYLDVPFYITLEAHLQDGKILFNDLLIDFYSKTSLCYDFHLALVKSMPSLLELVGIKSADSRTTLEEKIKYDPVCLDIQSSLKIELQKLGKAVETFSAELKTFSWLWDINTEEFLASYKQQNLSSEAISKDIERFGSLLDEADVPTTATVAFVKLDASAVIRKIEQLTQSWQKAMIGFVLDSALESARKLTKVMRDDVEKLNHDPQTLQEVAEKTVFCQLTMGHMQSIETQLETLNDYSEILKSYKVTFTTELVQLLAEANEGWSNYLIALQMAKNSLEKSKDKFRTSMIEKGNLLSRDLSRLCSKVYNDGPFNATWKDEDAFKFLQEAKENLVRLNTEKELLINDFEIFGVDPPQLAEMQKVEQVIFILKEVWSVRKEWIVCSTSYLQCLFENLSVGEIMAKIEQISGALRGLSSGPAREWQIVEQTRAEVENLKHALPIVCTLRESPLRDRHWEQIQKVLNRDFETKSGEFTLRYVLTLGLSNCEEDVRAVCSQAAEEESIEKGLVGLKKAWKNEKLSTVFSKEGDLEIIALKESMLRKIDANLNRLANMEASQNVGPFTKEIKKWQIDLGSALCYFSQMETLQNELLDINPKLSVVEGLIPEDLNNGIMQSWENIVQKTKMAENIFKVIASEESMIEIAVSQDLLDQAQREIKIFLDQKVQEAPRLFYLSRRQLRDLYLNRNFAGEKYQRLIPKCFPGVGKLKLGRQTNEVLGFCTPCGETLLFVDSVRMTENIAEDIEILEEQMREALQGLQAKCCAGLNKNPTKSERWLRAFPGQTCVLASQVLWTAELQKLIEKSSKSDSRKPLKQMCQEHDVVVERLIASLAGNISAADRAKTSAFLASEMLLQRQTRDLLKYDCLDPSSIEIMSLMKYFWDEEANVFTMQQMFSTFQYSFRLYGDLCLPVFTTAMEKSLMHITTALHLKMSVAMQGSGECGKFETINGLAKLLGQLVIGFCCNSTTTMEAFGFALQAVVKLGAWGVFKSYMDIPACSLQEISYNLSKFLKAAASGKQDQVSCFGTLDFTVNPDTAIFLSLNRLDKNEVILPATLRSLFRPVALDKPDNMKILEMIMISKGFTEALSLATKLNQLEILCKLYFSAKARWIFESNYTLITIAETAVKQREVHSTLSEEEAVLHAAVSSLEPQLDERDLETFRRYSAKIFPGIELITYENDNLKAALEAEVGNQMLDQLLHQVEQGLELFLALRNSRSVILAGATGTGKTTVLKILMNALNKLKIPGFTSVKLHPIYTSTLTEAELLGSLKDGRWRAGALQKKLDEIGKDTSVESHWLYLDGHIDKKWALNLRKAIKTSYKFHLGDQFDLNDEHLKIIIETDTLESVAPHLIDHCSSILFDKTISWESVLKPWIANFKQGPLKQELKLLISEGLQRCFEFKNEDCSEKVRQTDFTAAHNFCTILQNLVRRLHREGSEKEMIFLAKNCFYFSVVWGIFGAVEKEKLPLVDEFIRALEPGIFPKKGSVYDYFIDSRSKKFINWTAMIPKIWRYNPNLPFHEIIVPSVTIIKYNYLVSIFITEKRHVLLSGFVGVGKSFICASIMKSLQGKDFYTQTLSATRMTDKSSFLKTVGEKLQIRSNDSFSHWKNKSLLLMIKDINLMKGDDSDTQDALEVLRQWLDHGFWIEESLRPAHVQDIHIVASMSHRGMDLALQERLRSKFAILDIPEPDHSELIYIFGSILSQHLLSFGEHIKVLGNILVEATVSLHSTLKSTLKPNLGQPQCVFSLRTLSQVIQGLILSSKDHHNTQHAMCKLWINEMMIAYGSRLIDKRHKSALHEELVYIAKDKLGVTFGELYPGKMMPVIAMYSDKEGEVNDQVEFTLSEARERLEQLRVVPNQQLLVLDETVLQVTRIVRILSQPSNHNLILIGDAGSGRNSLVKLASSIVNITCVTPKIEMMTNQNDGSFEQFWRNIFLRATFENEDLAILYEETLVSYGRTMDKINAILDNSHICKLFGIDELQQLSTAHDCDALSVMTSQVRRNVRHIFKVPPSSKILRDFLYNFPALLKCNMEVFGDWKYQKILQAAQNFLHNVPDEGMEKDKIAMCLAKFHNTITEENVGKQRQIAFTPVHLFECLQIYQNSLKEKQTSYKTKQEIYIRALQKMSASTKKLSELSANLLQAQRKVVESQRQCETALVALGQKKREVEEQKSLHERKQRQIEQEEVSIQQLARLAHQAMDEAIPCLEDADLALESIEPTDLQTLRSYGRPPPVVEMVMSAVMLMKQSDPTWAEAKRQLAETNFIDQLINFDKDRIPEKTLKAVGSVTNNEDFNVTKIETISNGAKLLAQWVLAIEKYGKIYRAAAPKRSKLERASKELREHQAQLADIFSKMSSLQNQLERQKIVHKKCLEEKKLLDVKVESMATELQRANDLLTYLSAEEEEWNNYVSNFDLHLKSLYGDCLRWTVQQVYFGPLDKHNRNFMNEKLNALMKELAIENGDCSLCASDDTDLVSRSWQLQGLYKDKYLEESARIVLSTKVACAAVGSSRPVLVYDPQELCRNWLINSLQDKIICLSVDSPELKIEAAAAKDTGKTVLVERVTETLNSVMSDLLALHKEAVFEHPVIIFFTTVDACKANAMMSTKFNFVNFSCQLEGLKNELLSIFTNKDNPAMECERIGVSEKILLESECAENLKRKILNIILDAEGTILDDEKTMDTLETTKADLKGANKKLATYFENEKSLDQLRELFAASCERSASFYMMLLKLQNLDATYEFRIKNFIETFEKSVSLKAAQNLSPKQRGDFVMEHAEHVYRSTLGRMKNKHKLVFSFLLCLTIMENCGNQFPLNYLDFISKKLIFETKPRENESEWLSEAAVSNLKELEYRNSALENISQSVTTDQDSWINWFQSERPEQQALPGEYQDLDPATKFALVAALRPDRLEKCVEKFVAGVIGEQFLENYKMDLAALVANSPPDVPIVILADEQIDVLSAIGSLAKINGVKARIIFNEEKCEWRTRENQLEWIIIYRPNELKSLNLSSRGVDESSRLIIVMDTLQNSGTSFPWDKCNLTTVEKTWGVKDTVQRIVQPLAVLDQNSLQMMWNFVLLHTCVLGRQIIIEGNYLQNYDFKDSDFSVAISLLKEFTALTDNPQKEYLEWIVEAAYLARVVNEVDRRLLTNISTETLWEHVFSASSAENSMQMCLNEDNRSFSTSHMLQEVSAALYDFPVNASFKLDLRQAREFRASFLSLMPPASTKIDEEEIFLSKGALKNFQALFLHVEIMQNAMPARQYGNWFEIHHCAAHEWEALRAEKVKPMQMRCTELQEAIEGKLLLTQRIACAAAEVASGRLPLQWLEDHFQDLKLDTRNLQGTLKAVELRAGALHGFISKLNDSIPPVVLGSYREPFALLCALKLDLCQHFSDVFSSSWTFSFDVAENEESENGIVLDGITLKGAGWDEANGFLVESPICTSTEYHMPKIMMRPSNFVFASDYQDFYMCPTYGDGNLNNRPLFMIPLHPGAKSEEHWTRLGVSLVCHCVRLV